MSLKTLADEVNGRLLTKRREMAALFEKKDEKTGRPDWQAADHDRFNDLRTEIDTLAAEARDFQSKAAAEADNAAAIADLTNPVHPSGFGGGGGAGGIDGAGLYKGGDGYAIDRHGRLISMTKSLGERVVESREFKARLSPEDKVRVELKDFDFKTTLSVGAGFAPANNRLPDVVPFAIRRVVIYDIVPQITVGDIGVVKYMEETTHTANNAGTLENTQLPENAYAFTERTAPIETVGSTLPVTEQQLADVPMVMGLVDQMMAADQMRGEETAILTGTGTSPQLQGFLTKTGVQTQAKGSDPAESAVYKAMTLIRYTGFAEPTAVVFHPTDWQNIRIHQDALGRYIWGDPWVPGPEMFWGVPVLVTPAETLGTALVGAFRPFSYVARRLGVTIEVGYSGSDWSFLRRTIRCYSRLALIIRRPAAFCTVTGL